MRRKDIIAGIIIIVALSALFIPFASESPDGLEKVASDKGFFSSAAETGSPRSRPLSRITGSPGWGIKPRALSRVLPGPSQCSASAGG